MFPLMFLLIAGLETAVNEASDLVEGRFDPRIVPQLHRTSTFQIFVLLRTKALLHLTKNSVFTSFQEFKKILPNTFIYESILIKIHMNANIMNTQIYTFNKYDLNGHWRSQKVTFMLILTLTYVLMDNFLSLFMIEGKYKFKAKFKLLKFCFSSLYVFFFSLFFSLYI